MQRNDVPFHWCTKLTLSSLAAALLSGCAANAFRQDFSSFDSAYADMLNHQMLLNLARLDNGHPAQFLAIGSIQSNYTFSGNASGGLTGNNTDQTVHTTGSAYGLVGNAANAAGNFIAGTTSLVTGHTANMSLGAVSNPQFQWIPLNNESVAKQLLEPVSAEVFYTLYQQGYPIDQLLRVMVERIETTVPHERELVLINSPTNGNVKSYARFLRVCAMLREMQRDGVLILETRNQFVPLADGAAYTKAIAHEKKKGKDNTQSDQAKPDERFQPTPEQLVSAEKDGFKWQKNSETGSWQIGKHELVPRFYLKKGAMEAASKSIAKLTKDMAALDNLLGLLEAGVTVKTGRLAGRVMGTGGR